jgi:hypothetical protein
VRKKASWSKHVVAEVHEVPARESPMPSDVSDSERDSSGAEDSAEGEEEEEEEDTETEASEGEAIAVEAVRVVRVAKVTTVAADAIEVVEAQLVPPPTKAAPQPPQPATRESPAARTVEAAARDLRAWASARPREAFVFVAAALVFLLWMLAPLAYHAPDACRRCYDAGGCPVPKPILFQQPPPPPTLAAAPLRVAVGWALGPVSECVVAELSARLAAARDGHQARRKEGRRRKRPLCGLEQRRRKLLPRFGLGARAE